MILQMTLDEVLVKAIEKEIESQRLYTELSRQVTDQAAKDAFTNLSHDEQGHENLLKKYLNGEIKEGGLGKDYAIDYKIAEHLNQPERTPGMKLEEVFVFAANREKASHELYLGLADIHPLGGEVRRLLMDMSLQELKHKQKVESLYTEVAFPQTDGG